MVAYFQHYPSDPDEIVGIAGQLFRASRDTNTTVDDVRKGAARATDAVDGDVRFPMAKAPAPVIRNGSKVTEMAQFVGGAMLLFAEAVRAYNTNIDGLNARLREDERGLDPGGPANKLRELEAERARYEAVLDDDAARVAGMLRRGPNAADEQYLREHGLFTYLDPNDPAVQSALRRMPEPGDDPQAWQRWWASLTLAQQVAVMALHPDRLGNANGLPAEVRDEANRIVLAEDYRKLTEKKASGDLTEQEAKALKNIEHVMTQLDAREKHTDPLTRQPVPVQLYVYDPYAFGGDGRVAIATGNLDDADHVAVTVPGVGSSVQGLLSGTPNNIYDESRRASGDSVAVLDWMGYDSPNAHGWNPGDVLGMTTDGMADDGARRLAADVAGLQTMRSEDPAHLTVIGSSYGSSTAAIAAEEYGMHPDDLVLVGSPGVNADDAGDLTTGRDHTWVGSASRDPIAEISGFTFDNDPAEEDFGANRFRAERVDRDSVGGLDNHGGYDDRNSEGLYNIGAIVAGRYDQVQEAEHRPSYNPDPEDFRQPQHLRHP
jgi:hypothetical protein